MNKIFLNKAITTNLRGNRISYNFLKFKNHSKNFSSLEDRNNTEIIDTDVLIVGGGVAGLTFASALLKNEYFKEKGKIVVIDQPFKRQPELYSYSPKRLPDARVVSLSPASIRFLKSIGMWDKLDQRLIKYIKAMQVWESKGSSHLYMESKENTAIKSVLDFISNKNSFFSTPNINLDYMSALVEINHLLEGCYKLLDEYNSNRIEVMNYKLDINDIHIENSDFYSYLELKKEQKTFRTKLLIASDGANSIIRNKLNFSTFGYEYNETGLVCTFRGNRASDVAYQRFLHNGIFALLPLYDDLYSIVCSMPRNLNENLKKLDDKNFLEFVNRILHDPSEDDLLVTKLDRIIPSANNFNSPPVMTEILSKRFEFPLQLKYAKDNIYKNTILIGDAAHSIHPMAGLGMNLGICDSVILANEILCSINLGRRINDKRTLEAFAFKSELNYKSMISIIEAIKTSYLPTDIVFTNIRNIVNSISNKSSFLKSMFMTVASGELAHPKKYAWE